MKTFASVASKITTLLLVLAAIVLPACERSKGIPFDRNNARNQVIPYDSIVYYIKSFADNKRRLVNQGNENFATDSVFSVAESFNRDAIIALLNAPDATSLRIYFGYKPGKRQVVFCLLPTDAKGNDIKVNLLGRDDRTALNVPGISPATARGNSTLEGVENGQKCPTVCSQ